MRLLCWPEFPRPVSPYPDGCGAISSIWTAPSCSTSRIRGIPCGFPSGTAPRHDFRGHPSCDNPCDPYRKRVCFHGLLEWRGRLEWLLALRVRRPEIANADICLQHACCNPPNFRISAFAIAAITSLASGTGRPMFHTAHAHQIRPEAPCPQNWGLLPTHSVRALDNWEIILMLRYSASDIGAFQMPDQKIESFCLGYGGSRNFRRSFWHKRIFRLSLTPLLDKNKLMLWFRRLRRDSRFAVRKQFL
jgi:hypothetical protein